MNSCTTGKLLATGILLFATSAQLGAAATLSVTPNALTNSYAGLLTLQIGGLTNGETVLVERFLDPNSNGTIEASEPLVQSFKLTDGQVSKIGGVQNANVPGDTDGSANGQITATLSFAHAPEFTRGSGNQIFRVSSPFNRFTPVQQLVSITQATLPRKITGTVTTNGSPAAYAWVAALVQIGTDQRLVTAGTANASGAFTLDVTNGVYQMLAFKPGFVGSFNNSPQVSIFGADTNVTVPLTTASFSLSGSITEATSQSGIAGVQFFGTDNNGDYTVFFSDALGNFTGHINTGVWKFDTSDYSAALGGFIRSQNKTAVNVGTTNVSGVSITLTKATAMIYGTLETDQLAPLSDIRLSAIDSANVYISGAYTDANGRFFLPTVAGDWTVGVDQPAFLAGYIPPQAQVSMTAGQAVLTNLLATKASAYLVGKALDNKANPITNGLMFAFGTTGQNRSGQIGSDGSFAVGVSGGTWNLQLDTQTAASANLVGPQISFAVTDGVSISNINYVALTATRVITGSVKTTTNTPVSAINVFAGAQINGTNFNVQATTDANGNFSLPVVAALWYVAPDSQQVMQLGYPSSPSLNIDTTSGNQTANFVLGAQPIGTVAFRQNMGVVGEFGPNTTPTGLYPVGPKNYRVIFHVYNETNPPSASTVLFTGPPGSGLTNSPADPNFGAVQNGTDVFYFSMAGPGAAPGGTWTITYKNTPNALSVPDPQVFSRLVVPVPSVTVSSGVVSAIHWTYRDANGNLLSGIPAFLTKNRIDLLDRNGVILDSEVFPATNSFTYPSSSSFAWADIGLVRMAYFDTLTNQFFLGFSESSPAFSPAGLFSGNYWQIQLNATPGQNYTVQYSATLGHGSWTTLYVTNPPSSPFTILDPGATNSARFYRVLVGP